MKKVTPFIILTSFTVLTIVCVMQIFFGVFWPKIEQDINNTRGCFVATYVWYRGNIVWSKFDLCGDSIIEARYKQAKEVRKILPK